MAWRGKFDAAHLGLRNGPNGQQRMRSHGEEVVVAADGPVGMSRSSDHMLASVYSVPV